MSPANQSSHRALGPGTRADSRAGLNSRLFLPTSLVLLSSLFHHSKNFSRVNVVLVATWLPVRRSNKRYNLNENIILLLTCRASHDLH